jgi:subtilisin family serine protease
VAVLDTGIDATHEAFNGASLVQKDFTGEGLQDDDGHGTHCAGTIFGRRVGDVPRFGVAPGVRRAIIGKVLGRTSGGSSRTIVEAIHWAATEGATIISMSLGIDFPGYVKALVDQGEPVDFATSLALQEYGNNVRLFDKLAGLVSTLGVMSDTATVLVAAAGNESRRRIRPDYRIGVSPPANAEDIVSVGAIGRTSTADPGFVIADFSNTGPRVVAPGVGVLSARSGGGYNVLSGTSMATPHAAGVAALWAERLQKERRLSSSMLINKLVGESVRMPSEFDPLDIGAGLVRAPV